MKHPTDVVNSSNVEAVRFDETNKQLFVTYRGNATYRYDNVPEQDGLIIEATAQHPKISTGQLINKFIKKTKLPYTKL